MPGIPVPAKNTSGVVYRRLVLVVLALGLTWAAPAAADPHDDQARVRRALAGTQVRLETASARLVAAEQAYAEATARLPGARSTLAVAQGVLAGAQARARSAG